MFSNAPVRRGDIVWRHIPGLYTVFDETSFKTRLAAMSHTEVVYELTHVFGLPDFPECLIRIHDDGALINYSDSANVATQFEVALLSHPDPASSDYLAQVTSALLEDRFALVATRDIKLGEELTNDYTAEIYDPPFYTELCTHYGVHEAYLDSD